MVLIPFSLVPISTLKRISNPFMKWGNAYQKVFPLFQLELDRVDFKIDTPRYVAMCVTAALFLFVFLLIVCVFFFSWLGIAFAAFITLFVFMLQLRYPSVSAYKRVRKLDTELLAALHALSIQIDAGVPLFEAMVAVSSQDLGEVSVELKKVVKKISGGVPQIEALEELALKNPSPYFRRAIWQIINGMKQGSQINPVIRSVIDSLSQEQIIQIEKYGSQLGPLAMFYMMGAVIMPGLGITFIVILSAFIGFEESLIKGVLWGFIVFIAFFQMMFSGAINSKRPTLLGE